MVTDPELRDEANFNDIRRDIKEECERFGIVLRVTIPRPSKIFDHVPGLGFVFVQFKSKESAVEAKATLHGRSFDGRTVEATYFDEVKFVAGQLAS